MIPEENGIILIGKDPSKKHVVVPKIESIFHDNILQKFCDAADFEVAVVRISPLHELPSMNTSSDVITLSYSSDDEMSAGVSLPKTPSVINIKKFVTRLAAPQNPFLISAPRSPQAARPLSPPHSPRTPQYASTLVPAPWLNRSRLPSPQLGFPWPSALSPSPTSPPINAAITHDCHVGCGFRGSLKEVLDHENTCVASGVSSTKSDNADKKDNSVSTSVDTKKNKPIRIQKSKPSGIKSKTSGIKKKKSINSKKRKEQIKLKLEERERQQAQRWERQRINMEQKRARQERKKMTQKILADSKASLIALQEHTSKYWTADAPLYGPVSACSAEWKEVELEFRNSFSREKNASDWHVHQINRIQNLHKNATFQAQRLMISKDQQKPAITTRSYEYPNDLRNLWHGTKKEAVEPIVNYGFDRSAMGNNGAVLGVGTYFSTDVDLPLTGECGNADRYTPPDKNGYKHLILSEVIMGNSVIGDKSYTIFPPGVHSTVDDLKKPEKVCIHHDNNTHAIYHLVLKKKK
jgi:hypothetical protein